MHIREIFRHRHSNAKEGAKSCLNKQSKHELTMLFTLKTNKTTQLALPQAAELANVS